MKIARNLLHTINLSRILLIHFWGDYMPASQKVQGLFLTQSNATGAAKQITGFSPPTTLMAIHHRTDFFRNSGSCRTLVAVTTGRRDALPITPDQEP